jgi:hypothetical protein
VVASNANVATVLDGAARSGFERVEAHVVRFLPPGEEPTTDVTGALRPGGGHRIRRRGGPDVPFGLNDSVRASLAQLGAHVVRFVPPGSAPGAGEDGAEVLADVDGVYLPWLRSAGYEAAVIAPTATSSAAPRPHRTCPRCRANWRPDWGWSPAEGLVGGRRGRA